MKGFIRVHVVLAAMLVLLAGTAAAQTPDAPHGRALHHGLTAQQMMQNVDRLFQDCETRLQEFAATVRAKSPADDTIFEAMEGTLSDMRQLRTLLAEHLSEPAHEHGTNEVCGCASLARMAARFELMMRQLIAERRTSS